MKALRLDVDVDAFWQRVRVAPARALLLDYDGTLAPFRPNRDEAVPYPGVRDALGRLLARGRSRVVVISGRPAREVDPLLGVHPRPEIWGSHGVERWRPDGTYEIGKLEDRARAALDKADAWVGDAGLAARLERKPAGLALHLRGMPAAEASRTRDAADAAWGRLVREADVDVHVFDGGIEMRPRGVDKGHAVRALVGDAGPAAAVAYLGDDRTDEDAFAALGDKGLSVLVRADSRPTRADVWVRPPEELLGFLDAWAAAEAERP